MNSPLENKPPKSKNRLRRRTAGYAIIAFTLLMLSFGSWALASPVGSSPDEDFHLASIWCGNGERSGLCESGSSVETRMIPDSIERAICFAHEPTVSAACQGESFLDGSFDLHESDRVNGDGLYPSGYYFWASHLASDNLVTSTLLLRVAQAALFSTLSICLWLLLPRVRKLAMVGGIVATFVPFGMFLIPSINPSGWAISSTALLVPALIGYLTSAGWRMYALGGIALIGAAMGFGARGDSAAYAAIGIVAALILGFERSRQFLWRAILPLVLLAIAAVSFLGANQTASALGGGMTIDGSAPSSKLSLVVVNFMDLPELFFGTLGQNFDGSPYSGLGWLDTPMPAVVWILTTAVFSGVLFTALARFDWRKSLALTVVGLATIVIPMYLLVQNSVTVGWQIQPRYIMPLVIMVVIVALMPTRTTTGYSLPEFSFIQAALAGTALTVANSVALYIHMRRYVAPGDYNLTESAEWWWRSGPTPMTVWILGSISFGCVAALLILLGTQKTKLASEPGSGSSIPQQDELLRRI